MKRILLILFIAAMFFECTTPERRIRRVSTPATLKRQVATVSQPALTRQLSETLFYPMPPKQPRLQFLTSFTIEGVSEYRRFKLGGIQNFLQIQTPYDIGASRGKIYISDRISQKVIIVDLEKELIDHIRENYESVGIWVTEDDYKYVADAKKKRILVFDKKNRALRIFGKENQFDKPVDIAVHENKIYVCDINKHQIIVLDRKSGKTIQTIGGIGKEEGYFSKPTHVIVDILGNIYVNDFFNFRIQKFDRNGNFVKAFGYPGDTLGGFARPKGIGIDREGNLYVVDHAFENVQIFDNKTTDLLLFFGEFGLNPGEMYLPNAIHIDYNNIEYFKEYAEEGFSIKYLVYIGNRFGPTKLNVYGFGEWQGEHLPGVEKK
jgi:sugar lactone lactonase YvrE